MTLTLQLAGLLLFSICVWLHWCRVQSGRAECFYGFVKTYQEEWEVELSGKRIEDVGQRRW